MTISSQLNGQSILGEWETYDDVTNDKKAIIEIYKESEVYSAKIVRTFSDDENSICEICTGNKKNKPIIGLVIIEDIKKNGNEYNGGKILDPESGETYKCYLELVNDNKLKVRGYLGISIFGRTQYWLRKN